MARAAFKEKRKPAQDIAQANPNSILNAHQDWLNGWGQIALGQRTA